MAVDLHPQDDRESNNQNNEGNDLRLSQSEGNDLIRAGKAQEEPFQAIQAQVEQE